MSTRPLIAVDIGNSSTKIGWAFEPAAPSMLPAATRTCGFATGEAPPADLLASLPRESAHWAIASVHREGSRLLRQWLGDQRPADVAQQLTFRDLPIAVRAHPPDRVGLDRLAAAVAANHLRRPDAPAIIIDAGSAITVDLVAADGAFEGGAILPGFRMAAQALYSADLLPLALLEPNDQPPPALGADTDSAIRSGLFWGAVGAVRELAHRLSANLNDQTDVFITGGDLRQLALHIERSRYIPNLVLSGIALADQRA
jgi:type III pantothenate kinase